MVLSYINLELVTKLFFIPITLLYKVSKVLMLIKVNILPLNSC